IAGLASAIAVCSWLNCLMLYVVLHRRGHFRIEGWLVSRIARQLVSGGFMIAALYGIRIAIPDFFSGSPGHRMLGVAALVGGGMGVSFPSVWLLGGSGQGVVRAL